MADFPTCFAWVMTSEDPTYSYKATSDAPPGAFVISGINSKKFPIDFQTITAIPQANRGFAIRNFYEWNFWNKWLAQLQSNEVAKRVMDADVNEGPHSGVYGLQVAIEVVSGLPEAKDGVWGPITLEGANNCNPDMLAAAFRQARSDAYRELVKANPVLEKYLAGWLARAGR